jgi:N-acetylglucosamine kinase-like BadF-type ATPase
MVRLSFLPPGKIRATVADLAPVAEREARRGDRVAHSIVRQAAARLARTTLSVLRHIPDATVVLMTGGALAPGSLLRSWLRGRLRAAIPGIPIRPLSVPPVIGAVLIAGTMVEADEQRCWRSLTAWWRRPEIVSG